MKKLNEKKGTTLTEVMLSVALLAIIVIPLLGAVVSSVNTNVTSKDKTEAKALAEKVVGELKAKSAIPLGSVDLPESNGLVASYKITLDPADKGKVKPSGSTNSISPSPDTTFTYSKDIEEAKNADFELEIDQGDSASDGNVNVKLKDSAKNVLGTPLTNIAVTNKKLKFEIREQVVGAFTFYKYTFGDESATEKLFTPLDQNHIKLKVSYTNNVPNVTEQLKINTNIKYSTDFKVYLVDYNEENSGVCFINKGKIDFDIIYLDSHEFNYNSEINSLYKIEVIIKKGTKEIYKTSSYVKK